MKALKLSAPLTFSVIPREYPLTDDDLTLTLRHELTGDYLTPTFTFALTSTQGFSQKLVITITEQVTYFEENQKFEVEIKNGTDIIYLGKLKTFKAGTDIQNYEYSQHTTQRYGF